MCPICGALTRTGVWHMKDCNTGMPYICQVKKNDGKDSDLLDKTDIEQTKEVVQEKIIDGYKSNSYSSISNFFCEICPQIS